MTIIRFGTNMIFARAVLLAATFLAICQPAFPQVQAATTAEVSTGKATEISIRRIELGALVRAEIAKHVNWAHLLKGSVLEGNLSFPLYAGEEVALPAGTALRVIVDSSERVRDHQGFWRTTGHAITRAFNPLEKSQAPQYRVTLNHVELLLPSGEWALAEASVVRAGSALIVGSRDKRNTPGGGEAPALEQVHRAKNKPTQILLLQLRNEISFPPKRDATAQQSEPSPAGRRARSYLLAGLSASKSHEGDKFQAQLAEPVRFGDHVFGPGSLLEGTVVRCAPPRILSRAGMLHLRIDRLRAQNGDVLDVSGTLSRAEADAQSGFVLDEEGTLRGRKPGVANGIADLGISYALGKVSDDLSETPIRALGASMSDAAVANAARYIGLAGALTFLVTRHGRDVRLPKYAEIEIDFGRTNHAAAPPAGIP